MIREMGESGGYGAWDGAVVIRSGQQDGYVIPMLPEIDDETKRYLEEPLMLEGTARAEVVIAPQRHR
jgi:hypothetical protein